MFRKINFIGLCFFFLYASYAESADVPSPQFDVAALQTQEDVAKNVETMFQDDIVAQLISEKKNLQQWADELEQTPPETPHDVWITLNVCLRAGRDKTIRKMIPLMFNIFEPLPISSNSFYVYEITERLKSQWAKNKPELVIFFLETFDTIYCPTQVNDMFRNFALSQSPDWLKTRFQHALIRRPNEQEQLQYHLLIYQTSITQAAFNWHRIYVEKLTGSDLKAELERLSEEAKNNPNDTTKTEMLFNAIGAYRWPGNAFQNVSNWSQFLPSVEKCPAFNAWVISEKIFPTARMDTKEPSNDPAVKKILELTETFLRRAKDTPLTAEECNSFRRILQSRSSMVQPQRSDETIQQIFYAEVSDSLNQVFLLLDRTKEAQEIMEQTRTFRKEHNLPENTLLAGRTQAASETYVVEKEIKDRQPLDEKNPEYWWERYQYYKGRDNTEEQIKALRSGLDLLTTEEIRKKSKFLYEDFYKTLFNLLDDTEKYTEAAELFEEQYALTEGDMYSRLRMYPHDLMFISKFKGDYGEIFFLKLYKDLKDSVERLKQMPETTNEPDKRREGGILESLVYRIFPVDNQDPLYWDALKMMRCGMTASAFEKLSRYLLFPSKDNYQNDGGTLDEDAFKKIEELMQQKVFNWAALYHIGTVLSNRGKPQLAMTYLEEALNEGNKENELWHYYREQINVVIFSAALKLGDAARAEEIALECTDGTCIRFLQDTLSVAEKTDNKLVADRVRRRLANLGL